MRFRGRGSASLPSKGSGKLVPVFVLVFSSFRVHRSPRVSATGQQKTGVALQPPLIHCLSVDVTAEAAVPLTFTCSSILEYFYTDKANIGAGHRVVTTKGPP